MTSTKAVRLAVLIDTENVTPAVADELFAAVAKLGTATVRRAYGNWGSPAVGAWKAAAQQYAMQPVHQYSCTSGKNVTDIALIIDAMDLLHSGHVDGFCLVASDGDYTQLAIRLRTQGLPIYGFGLTTPHPALVAACTKYIRLGLPKAAAPVPPAPRVSGEPSSAELDCLSGAVVTRMEPDELRELLTKCVQDAADDDGWALLSEIGKGLLQHHPAFSVKAYSYATLTKMLEAQAHLEVKQGPNGVVRARLAPSVAAREDAPIDLLDGAATCLDDAGLRALLTQAVQDVVRDDGWSLLANVGHAAIQRCPSFSAKTYGFETLSKLLATQSYIEVQTSQGGVLRARLSSSGAHQEEAEKV